MLFTIIFLIAGNYLFFYILPILYFLNYRIIYLSIFIIGIIQAFIFNYPLKKFYFLNNKNVIAEGEILNISENKFLIFAKKIFYKHKTINFNEKILVYHKKGLIFSNLKKGNLIQAKIKFKIPRNYNIPGSFNYVNYLKGKQIKFIGFLISKKIAIKKIKQSFLNHYKNILLKKIDSQNCKNLIKDFEKALITGDKNFINKYEKKFLIQNGISHLFVISGLHISIIFLFFLYLSRFFFIKVNNYYLPFFVSLLFTSLYVVFTGMNYPSIRAFFIIAMLVFLLLLKRKRDPLQILFFILFVIIIVKPFGYLNLSLQYSFIIVFFLIIFFKIFKFNKLLSVPAGSILCFIVGIPLTSYYFSAIYIKGLVSNLIAVPFFSILIIPFSTIFVFLPVEFLLKILSFNFSIIINILKFLPDFKPLFIFKLTGYEVFLWYFIIFFSIPVIKFFNIKKFTMLIFLISIAIFIYFKNHDFKEKIGIINAGRTKAVLINHKRQNILIDGGKNQIILNYLIFEGVRKLDWLILTKYSNLFLPSTQFLISNFKIENFFYPGKLFSKTPDFIKIENKKILIYKKILKLRDCKKVYCELNF